MLAVAETLSFFPLHLTNRIHWTLSGGVGPECLARFGEAIRQECDEHGRNGAVADFTKVCGGVPADLYRAGRAFAEAVGPLIRVAFLHMPDDWHPADVDFLRGVVNTRGGRLDVFTNEYDAIGWVDCRTGCAV